MRGTEGGDVFYEENSKKAYKPPRVYTQVKEKMQEEGKEQEKETTSFVDEGFKEYVRELALSKFPGSEAKDLGFAWAVFSPEYLQHVPVVVVKYDHDVTIGDVENQLACAERTLASWKNAR